MGILCKILNQNLIEVFKWSLDNLNVDVNSKIKSCLGRPIILIEIVYRPSYGYRLYTGL